MKTLYISDLDGTLLNKNAELSSFAEENLNRIIDNGLNFSIATARTSASVLKILKNLKLNLPIVLMNGVTIYDIQNNKHIKNEYICKEALHNIIKIIKKININGFMYKIVNDELITYYQKLDTEALQDFYQERYEKYYKSFSQIDDFNEIIDDAVVYFTFIGEKSSLDVLRRLVNEIPFIKFEYYKDNYTENLWYLEIFSENASKYNAVKYIRNLLKPEKIIGFGDNLNDIPFMEACDKFYAVSNAREELKNLSTGIIDSNENDAVVKFLLNEN